ncbi:MAG: ATP-grasp domain-containing protein [Elusimicrobiota bacterium]|nr:ATP-grasp domain-containing protein [Endomicrobiia bacterium]MCX7948397.1 ATP-grasp domain-containing protein [candidate division WOR-3 bacterium]MDW7973171.1 ATP-grasp domain-containing protein [Thermodesulfovibrio sp.]MDW8166504.1 ATP-grasp domain-containing protein [Elusimicrobiota bacterium]
MKKKYRILLTEASFKTSLWVARAIKKWSDKYEIIGIDTLLGGALLSRYVDFKKVVRIRESYIQEIIKIMREQQIDIVFPHLESTYLSLYEASPEVKIVAPPRDLALIVTNKLKVCELIKDMVKFPHTEVIQVNTQDDVKECVDKLYEIAVNSNANSKYIIKVIDEINKPFGPMGRYIIIDSKCFDDRDFSSKLFDFIQKNKILLLQEYIQGYGVGVGGLWKNGKPLLVGGHRRLIESHRTGGISIMAESYIHDQAIEISNRIMSMLNYTGIGMVEFKISEKDGTPYFMEINPRLWGTIPLYIYSGLNIPLAACEMFLEDVSKVDYHFTVGKRMFFMRDFLISLYPPSSNSIYLLNSLAKNIKVILSAKEGVYLKEDFSPFLYDMLSIFVYYLKRTLKSIFKRIKKLLTSYEKRMKKET